MRPRIWTTEAPATGSGRLGGIRTCHAHAIVKGPDASNDLSMILDASSLRASLLSRGTKG